MKKYPTPEGGFADVLWGRGDKGKTEREKMQNKENS
jgi:hypothetical protein